MSERSERGVGVLVFRDFASWGSPSKTSEVILCTNLEKVGSLEKLHVTS